MNTSLLSRCIDAVELNIELYKANLKYLPIHIKDTFIKGLNNNNSHLSAFFRRENLNLIVHSKVKILDLRFLTFGNDHIKAISVCKDLQCLTLGRIDANENDFVNLFTHFNHLYKLKIEFCGNEDYINDEIICSVIQNCSQLSHLVLKCKLLSDRVLDSLIEYCPYIKAIDLSFSQVTSDGVKRFIDKFGEQLCDVRLNHCDQITDKTIQLIIRNCPNIEMLSYNYCQQVTHEPLQLVNKNLKQLFWTIPW